jgi:hypothetical protein
LPCKNGEQIKYFLISVERGHNIWYNNYICVVRGAGGTNNRYPRNGSYEKAHNHIADYRIRGERGAFCRL